MVSIKFNSILICAGTNFVCMTLLSDIDMHDVTGYTVSTQYLQNLSIYSAKNDSISL